MTADSQPARAPLRSSAESAESTKSSDTAYVTPPRVSDSEESPSSAPTQGTGETSTVASTKGGSHRGARSQDDDGCEAEPKPNTEDDPGGAKKKKKAGGVKAPGARRTVLNTCNARSSHQILLLICNERRWVEERCNNTRGNIFWLKSREDLTSRLERLKKGHTQAIARVPGFYTLCHKVPFARLMADASAINSSEFWPKTWVLPDEKVPASEFKGKKCLVFKPDDGAQGDGVHLLMRPADLERRISTSSCDAAVVQQYLSKPMLLDGRLKFDFRMYVLVLSLSPKRMFLCREGLVRVCSEPYEPPNARNAHKAASHLTNYSLNKYSATFEHVDNPDDGTAGTKRTLSSVLKHLEENAQIDQEEFWEQLDDIALNVTSAMVAAVLDEVPSVPRDSLWDLSELGETEQTQCFHLMGMDIILDESGKPWLLEMNANPSLSIDSVYPIEGPHACVPPETAPGDPWHKEVTNALKLMKRPNDKPCKCMSHHRPHVHYPCKCDMMAKLAAVGGALSIVRRHQRARFESSNEDLCEGTAFVPLN